MHLRAAAINDLSGLGRCSLTADIAVLAAMGIDACPLPTAVLTAQTGYAGFRCVPFADHMESYRKHWQELGVSFQGILSGYLASPDTVRRTAEFVETFRRPGVTYLCDPVLGDNGRVYRGFTDASVEAMRSLALRADLLTPNLTEFCILTGTDMDAMQKLGEAHPDELFAALARKAAFFKDTDTVITGIPFRNEEGRQMLCNLVLTQGTQVPVSFPHLGGTYSGTGDLFAAVLLGGRLQHRDLEASVRLAGTFISRGIESARRNHTPYNDGIDYESCLSLLLP